MGGPEIWLNIIWGVLLDVISIRNNRLSSNGLSSPVWVGTIQSAEGLNRTKDGGRKNSAFPAWLLELGRRSSALGAPACPTFGLGPNHATGSPRSPARRQQTVQPISLHNYVSRFLIINVFLRTYRLYWFCFSGERSLIDTPTQPHARVQNLGLWVLRWF